MTTYIVHISRRDFAANQNGRGSNDRYVPFQDKPSALRFAQEEVELRDADTAAVETHVCPGCSRCKGARA